MSEVLSMEAMSAGGGTIDRTKLPNHQDTSALDIFGDLMKSITKIYESDRSVDLVDKPEEDIPQKKLKRSTSQVIDVKSSPKNPNLTSHDYIELKMNLARELQEEKLRMLREKHELETKILLATVEKPSDNDSLANDKPALIKSTHMIADFQFNFSLLCPFYQSFFVFFLN